MNEINFAELAAIFKALSHPKRAQIAAGLMKKDECNVNKMVEVLEISQPAVSQHLTVLKAAGIIEGYRKGTQVCYKLTNETVRKLYGELL